LATEVGLEAASPDPVAESRAAIAPTLSDEPAPAPEPAKPERTERAITPPPKPKTSARTPTAQPTSTRDRSRPDRTPPKPAATPKKATEKGGGSLIGDDFLEGKGSSTTTQETRAPAAKFGSTERSALNSAITRQLRPHWQAPSGLDAEKLVSFVSWELNPDGSLNGTPRCRTDPASISDSNKPQAGLHCERAIRAVREAAKARFNLPPEFYSRWKSLEWEFNRRL
jgi:periplasmic protein TonB